MEFSEVLNLILESCPFLKNNDYDGIIVKKLAATNTITDTGASHQSHMAFTGKCIRRSKKDAGALKRGHPAS